MVKKISPFFLLEKIDSTLKWNIPLLFHFKFFNVECEKVLLRYSKGCFSFIFIYYSTLATLKIKLKIYII